jgi:hypothetical protein
MALEPKIGGYKTSLNISDLAESQDGSITITPEGDLSQTIKNNPERYYGAPSFGRAFGANLVPLNIATDSTFVQTVVMDLTGTINNPPTLTFEANSLNSNIPEVTLYWMTTTSPQKTVFATCSGSKANSSTFNIAASWDSLWYPTGYGLVMGMDFHPKKNYTEMAIGGHFNDLGLSARSGATPGLNNSYNRYAIINLSAGTNVFNTIEGNNVNFGPLGRVLSGSKADIGYAGGIDGLRLGSTSLNSQYIRAIKYISISATSAPGVPNAVSKSRNYLCLGGEFTSVRWATSSIRTQGLFIIDIDRPKTHFCRFDFGENVRINNLEYDPDYQSLIITTFDNINTARMLSGLSSASLSSSYMGIVDRASEGDRPNLGNVEVSSGSLKTIARLYLGYRDSLPGNSTDDVPLWRRFHFDSKFGQQAGAEFRSYAHRAIYLNDVVYLGGNLVTTGTAQISGATALYCGEGRFGSVDSNYYPFNLKHAQIGKSVYSLPIDIFGNLAFRWSQQITFKPNDPQNYSNVFDIKIKKQQDKTYFYIAGSFKAFSDQNGITTKQPDNKTFSRFVAVFDITDSLISQTFPQLVTNWKPYPSSYVTGIETGFEGEGDENVVYLIGHFTTVQTTFGVLNRVGCCALTKPDPAISVSVLNWTANFGYRPAGNDNLRTRKIYNIPNTSPLSGLIIHSWDLRTINGDPANNICRVSRYAQNIAPYQQKAIVWQISPKILEGSDLAVPGTSFFNVTSVAGSEYNVNTTIFDSENIKNNTEGAMDNIETGSLMRFVLRRPGLTPLSQEVSAQYYTGRAWVLGAKIDQSHSS